MRTIEEIKKSSADARARASAVLTPDQVELAAALAEEEDARSAEFAEVAKLRALRLAEKVELVSAEVGNAYGALLGVDLASFFPPGKAPPAAQLPAGGLIVIRSSPPETEDFVAREVEAKKMPLSQILGRVLCDSTISPSATAPADLADRTTLGQFVIAYPNATAQAAGKARELAGAKAAAEAKRGQ